MAGIVGQGPSFQDVSQSINDLKGEFDRHKGTEKTGWFKSETDKLANWLSSNDIERKKLNNLVNIANSKLQATVDSNNLPDAAVLAERVKDLSDLANDVKSKVEGNRWWGGKIWDAIWRLFDGDSAGKIDHVKINLLYDFKKALIEVRTGVLNQKALNSDDPIDTMVQRLKGQKIGDLVKDREGFNLIEKSGDEENRRVEMRKVTVTAEGFQVDKKPYKTVDEIFQKLGVTTVAMGEEIARRDEQKLEVEKKRVEEREAEAKKAAEEKQKLEQQEAQRKKEEPESEKQADELPHLVGARARLPKGRKSPTLKSFEEMQAKKQSASTSISPQTQKLSETSKEIASKEIAMKKQLEEQEIQAKKEADEAARKEAAKKVDEAAAKKAEKFQKLTDTIKDNPGFYASKGIGGTIWNLGASMIGYGSKAPENFSSIKAARKTLEDINAKTKAPVYVITQGESEKFFNVAYVDENKKFESKTLECVWSSEEEKYKIQDTADPKKALCDSVDKFLNGMGIKNIKKENIKAAQTKYDEVIGKEEAEVKEKEVQKKQKEQEELQKKQKELEETMRKQKELEDARKKEEAEAQKKVEEKKRADEAIAKAETERVAKEKVEAEKLKEVLKPKETPKPEPIVIPFGEKAKAPTPKVEVGVEQPKPQIIAKPIAKPEKPPVEKEEKPKATPKPVEEEVVKEKAPVTPKLPVPSRPDWFTNENEQSYVAATRAKKGEGIDIAMLDETKRTIRALLEKESDINLLKGTENEGKAELHALAHILYGTYKLKNDSVWRNMHKLPLIQQLFVSNVIKLDFVPTAKNTKSKVLEAVFNEIKANIKKAPPEQRTQLSDFIEKHWNDGAPDAEKVEENQSFYRNFSLEITMPK